MMSDEPTSSKAFQEVYISVDIETAGPNPGQYSLLSIGACTLDEPSDTFYVELKPGNLQALPEALDICQLSLEELEKHGLPPSEAMRRFEDWVVSIMSPGKRPVFVGFNAPFDWMFVNEYFYRFLGRNPFGHTALDIKAFYMGLTGCTWSETSMREVSQRYLDNRHLNHHALNDALDQAHIFRKILEEAKIRKHKETHND